MKRAVLFLAFSALALVQSSVPGASAQKQKEVRVTPHHVDGGRGEQTSLDALVGLSDAVVVGRVIAARPSNIKPSSLPAGAGEFFSTAYSLNIERVLQWSTQLDTPPPTIVVEILGVGEVDRGAYIERHISERYRQLVSGATYVLFIKTYALGRSADARVVWVPASGDGQSIVEIRGVTVAPQASTRLALDLAALTPTALFDKVKRVPKAGRR